MSGAMRKSPPRHATVCGLIELDACTCLADVTRLAREREQLEAERRAAARERLRVKS